MSRRKISFNNIRFFTKKTLRKYKKSSGAILEKNQSSLTYKNVNEEETSFKRKQLKNNGIISTQQLPVDNSNFANNTFFGSAEVKVNIAFEKIVNKYPFDGTFSEIEKFEDQLSSFEKYVFDRFPKSRGFLTLDSSLNQYIQVKDRSGHLSSTLLKGKPGESYINVKDKSFSIEMCLRLPEDSSFNQNSYIFHCINSSELTSSGFAAFIDGYDYATATISVNSTAFSTNILTIRDLVRTVNFEANGASTTPSKPNPYTGTYKFGTQGVVSNNDAAVRIKDAINLALSNKDLLVEASVNSSDINLKQRRRGQPIDVNIDGTMTQGSPPAIAGSTFSGFSEDHNETNLKFAIISGSLMYASTSCRIKKGEWHNLNFVYDKSTNSQQFLSIKSGSNSLSTSDFFEISSLDTYGQDLFIGSGPSDLIVPGSNKLLFENKSTLSACIDEFRLFHGLRNKKEVDYFSRRDIFAYDNMRILFRFNEPTGSHDNNDVILDSSGHSLHTRISNFTEAVRDPAGINNPMFLEKEKYNPVLFPSQKDVLNLNSDLLENATEYDMNNPNKITKLIPQHYFHEGFLDSGISVDGNIVENYSSRNNLPNSGKIGSAQIMNMMLYFMAEELDSYKMYLDQASELLFPDYLGETGTADNFLQNQAEYYGFELPNIFGNVSQEQFTDAENLGANFAVYEKSLSKIQSIIWRRVLKNLNYIMSMKGTKDSIKSVFRSSGIEPDRLFRLVEFHGKNEFRLGSSRQTITEMSTMLNFSGSLTPRKDIPRGDGTFTNQPLLLSVPLSGSRIEPGFPNISGNNVLSTASLTFHPTRASFIPSVETEIAIKDAYNNFFQLEVTDTPEVVGLSEASAATATITIDDGDAALSVEYLGYLKIKSFDNVEKKYVFVQGAGAVATGTILKVGDDVGVLNLHAGLHSDVINPAGHSIAVRVPESGAKKNDILAQLKLAILHANGHNGRIKVSSVPAVDNGSQSITLTQKALSGGAVSNSSITAVPFNDLRYMPSVSGFTGGSNILVSRKNSSAISFNVKQSRLSDLTTAAPQLQPLDYIEISTGTGETKKYVAVSGNGSVTNGKVLAAGDNYNGSDTLPEGHSLIGGIAVSGWSGNAAISKHGFLLNLRATITSNAGHGGEVYAGVLPAINAGIDANLDIESINSSKYITKTLSLTNAKWLPSISYQDASLPSFVKNISSVITGSSRGTITSITKRSDSASNINVVKLATKDFSRRNLGNHTILVNSSRSPQAWINMTDTAPTNLGSMGLNPAYAGTVAISNETISGRAVKAAAFDGAGDLINMGTAAAFNSLIGGSSSATKKLTLAAWVYQQGDGAAASNRVFNFGNNNIVLYTLDSNPDNNGPAAIRFFLNSSTNSAWTGWGVNKYAFWATTSKVLTYNNWHHVAVTYDASSPANDPIIYLNGEAQTIAFNPGNAPATRDSDNWGSWFGTQGDNCCIGNRVDGLRHFHGKIAEAQVFNEILDASDIYKMYSATSNDYAVPPFFKSEGFSAGNGMVRAGTQGYENAGISSSKNDGIFTSGSWSIDAMYQFPGNLPKNKKRSLSRLVVTGDENNSLWKDKHGVLSNLVLNEIGDILTLYVRSNSKNTSPIFTLHLTGANILNGQKWYIAYGRKRSDEISIENTSMYFLRAASYTNSQVDKFIENELVFEEMKTGSGNYLDLKYNLFQNSEPESNNHFSAPRIMIGKHQFSSVTNNDPFLNSVNQTKPSLPDFPDLVVVPDSAQTSYFDGKVGHIKFWSKALTYDESLEHAKNFKSVGVDNPIVNNTFSITNSGSFGKLRLNLSTDQIEKSTDVTGSLKIVDFSRNFTSKKCSAGISLHSSGAICYGFENNSRVIKGERFDYTIMSPFYDEYIEDNRVKIAGFSDGENVKLYNSKISPVTEIMPYEKTLTDNRFEIQINVQRGLNEDIMNIFSSIDALDNALGQPNLQFSRDYPDLRYMRNLYFDRLTDKVNYRNFFDLFRWIDDAFSEMIEKLIPRNVDFIGINLIIESHALERYKIAYGHHDIYKGEDERDKLKSTLLVSQRSGVIRRF